MTFITRLIVLLVLVQPAAAQGGGGPANFDAASGLPTSWRICAQSDDSRCRELLATGETPGRMSSGPGASWVWRTSDDGLPTLSPGAPGPWFLEVAPGSGFRPQPLAGLGAMYNGIRVVVVTPDGQRRLEPGAAPVSVEAGKWAGIRTRFWTLLVSPKRGALTVMAGGDEELPVLRLSGEGAGPATLRVYAGPVDGAALSDADPVLTGMLYAALWDWLRWLCFGMAWLFAQLVAVTGHPGVAVVALSIAVKILMTPLVRVADRWQSEVHRIQAKLAPELDEIRARYKGEEANTRTLEVYRRHGVHPMYTVKSLGGFAIQVPIFIAAFDMLGESFTLYQSGFLWIRDLAWPDAVAALGFGLPFMGSTVNALPVAMTVLTVLASSLQRYADLTPGLQRQQRVRLYWMAIAFFVLLYPFPAGMVLYWTTSNLTHLLKVLVTRVRDDVQRQG